MGRGGSVAEQTLETKLEVDTLYTLEVEVLASSADDTNASEPTSGSPGDQSSNQAGFKFGLFVESGVRDSAEPKSTSKTKSRVKATIKAVEQGSKAQAREELVSIGVAGNDEDTVLHEGGESAREAAELADKLHGHHTSEDGRVDIYTVSYFAKIDHAHNVHYGGRLVVALFNIGGQELRVRRVSLRQNAHCARLAAHYQVMRRQGLAHSGSLANLVDYVLHKEHKWLRILFTAPTDNLTRPRQLAALLVEMIVSLNVSAFFYKSKAQEGSEWTAWTLIFVGTISMLLGQPPRMLINFLFKNADHPTRQVIVQQGGRSMSSMSSMYSMSSMSSMRDLNKRIKQKSASASSGSGGGTATNMDWQTQYSQANHYEGDRCCLPKGVMKACAELAMQIPKGAACCCLPQRFRAKYLFIYYCCSSRPLIDALCDLAVLLHTMFHRKINHRAMIAWIRVLIGLRRYRASQLLAEEIKRSRPGVMRAEITPTQAANFQPLVPTPAFGRVKRDTQTRVVRATKGDPQLPLKVDPETGEPKLQYEELDVGCLVIEKDTTVRVLSLLNANWTKVMVEAFDSTPRRIGFVPTAVLQRRRTWVHRILPTLEFDLWFTYLKLRAIARIQKVLIGRRRYPRTRLS